MQFQTHTSIDDIPIGAASWKDLAGRAGAAEVFLSRAWIRAWWNNFGDGFRLYFITAEEGGEVIAFAPLMLDRRRRVRFIGDGSADYVDFAVATDEAGVTHGFLDFLHDNRSIWKSGLFRNVPEASSLGRSLLRPDDSQLVLWKSLTIDAPSLLIRGHEESARAMLAKYSLRRSETRLRRKGKLEYRVFRSASEAKDQWPRFFEQHRLRSRDARRKSAFSDARYRRFVQDLFESDTDSSLTHFSGLFLNEHPVAYHFGLVSDNRLLWYKPSFDPGFAEDSPGLALIRNLIEFALTNDFDELDFTIGAEAFKQRFCNVTRRVHSIRAYHSRVRRALHYAYAASRRFGGRILRRHQ